MTPLLPPTGKKVSLSKTGPLSIIRSQASSAAPAGLFQRLPPYRPTTDHWRHTGQWQCSGRTDATKTGCLPDAPKSSKYLPVRYVLYFQFLAYMYMGRAFVEIMQCREEPQCLPAVASFSIWPQSDSRCPHLVGGGSSLPPGVPGRGRGREDKKKRHATDQPGNLT